MRFVDDDVFEAEFFECGLLDEAYFVARYAHFEVLSDESVRNDLCALFFGSREDDDVHVRSPLFELARPVLESRFGDDD